MAQTQEIPGEGLGRVPVIGVGTGRGGAEALGVFLASLPSDLPRGVVVVQSPPVEPDPDLISTLAGACAVAVRAATDGERVQPGTVLVVPAGHAVTLEGDHLKMVAASAEGPPGLPVDRFLRSLATARSTQAIGVILAGQGRDGILGLRQIHEVGGLTLAQLGAVGTAEEMPRGASAAGAVDLCLSLEALAAELVATPHPTPKALPVADETPNEQIEGILRIVRRGTGRDFSLYKRATLARRIEKRLQITHRGDLRTYLEKLGEDPGEVRNLFREFLIGVTRFFRDPGVFAALKDSVLPTLVRRARLGHPLRVWVPACSTGEEAYSLAMLLHEGFQEGAPDGSFQIFATDIDGEAIERARLGVYPAGIVADVSKVRLQRFFIPDGDTYRVIPAIRDRIIFAPHSVVDDPPFSRLDLLSCRNLLIYMGTELQRKILALFHYALGPEGILLLGTSETAGGAGDLFDVVDGKSKIFQRREVDSMSVRLEAFSRCAVPVREWTAGEFAEAAIHPARPGHREVVERSLSRRYAPSAVLVDGRGEILYIHGDTGRYLRPPPGEPTRDLLRMLREDLRSHVALVFHEATRDPREIRRREIEADGSPDFPCLSLSVEALGEAGAGPDRYLVVFEDAGRDRVSGAPVVRLPETDRDRYVALLEARLREEERSLQRTVEDLRSANEEMQGANEELQAANEELQSTNEELETSREELQALNEELITVNMELREKCTVAARAESDMANLLAATEVAAVFLDMELRITRYTPASTAVIHLIEGDIGRPVTDITSELEHLDLAGQARRVLETLVPIRQELETRSGRRHLVRILPYRSVGQVIEGLVLTFQEVSRPSEGAIGDPGPRG